MIGYAKLSATPADWVACLESERSAYSLVTLAAGVYKPPPGVREVTLLGKSTLQIQCPPPIYDAAADTWQSQVTFDMSESCFRLRHTTFLAAGAGFIGGDRDLFDARAADLDLTACQGRAVPDSKGLFLRGRGRVHCNVDTLPTTADRPVGADGNPVRRDTAWDWSQSLAPSWADTESAHSIELRAQPVRIGSADIVWDRVVILVGGTKATTQAIAAKTGSAYLRNCCIKAAGGDHRVNYGVWSSRAQATIVETDPNPYGLEVGLFGFDVPILGNGSLVTTRGPMQLRNYRAAFGKDGGMVNRDAATSLDVTGEDCEEVRPYVTV